MGDSQRLLYKLPVQGIWRVCYYVINLIGTFKYLDFAVESLNVMLGTQLPRSGLLLPIGISFFSFQLISYLIDYGRRDAPLYTFRECLAALPAGERDAGILGVLSLVFWALSLVVTVKYVWCITRADNGGEGGIFALLALLRHNNSPSRKMTVGVFVIGIIVDRIQRAFDTLDTRKLTVLRE